MPEYIFIRYATGPNKAVSEKLQQYFKPNTGVPFTVLPGLAITAFTSDESLAVIQAGMESVPDITFELIERRVASPTSGAASRRPAANTTPTQRPSARTASTTAAAPTLAELKSQLRAALAAENFELAATLRDQISAMENPTPPASDAPTTERKLYTSINEFKKTIKKK